ncbi:MAG: hypothetical protein ACE5GA_06120 [Candidatus Zixiibacteriota bacterium]
MVMRRTVRTSLLSCVILAALAGVSVGQMQDLEDLRAIKSRSSVSLTPSQNPFSLLDLSRLKWSHSYSLSFGSGSSGSGSFGLYTSSLLYEFSPSLSMAFSLGVGHDPGALFDRTRQSNADLFPAFALDYHPNEKFRMSLSVARVPYTYSRFGDRYGSSYGYGLGNGAFGTSYGSFSPFYYPYGIGLR